jgi:hypothetical protein
MITIGTVVLKIAGRDAGRLGVVIDMKDGRVLIDGEVRRREVAVGHVEPVGQTVEVAKGASTASVREALKALGVEFPEPFANKRPRVGGPKPVKLRAADRKAAAKPAKKAKRATKEGAEKGSAPKKTTKKAQSSAKKAEGVEPEAADETSK